MSEERPRPQYGEYATPEQQASAAGLPYVPPAPHAAARVDAPPPVATQNDVAGQRDENGRRLGRAYSGDRLATLFLLGIGLFSFINAIPRYANYSTTLDEVDAQLGLGTFPLASLADKAGYGLLIAHIVLFLLTAGWALRTISKGRRAFYIPVVGFIAFGAVYTVVLTILFHADPTFWAQIATKFG